MGNRMVLQNTPFLLQIPENNLVGIFNVQSLVGGYLGCEISVRVQRNWRWTFVKDADHLAESVVLLAEAGGTVNEAGTGGGGNKVGTVNFEGTRLFIG